MKDVREGNFLGEGIRKPCIFAIAKTIKNRTTY